MQAVASTSEVAIHPQLAAVKATAVETEFRSARITAAVSQRAFVRSVASAYATNRQLKEFSEVFFLHD